MATGGHYMPVKIEVTFADQSYHPSQLPVIVGWRVGEKLLQTFSLISELMYKSTVELNSVDVPVTHMIHIFLT